MDNKQIDILDVINLISFAIGAVNYKENLEQSSNDDIMKKLDEQTKEMLGDIHEQLKKINERIDSLEMGRGNKNENS